MRGQWPSDYGQATNEYASPPSLPVAIPEIKLTHIEAAIRVQVRLTYTKSGY